MGSLWHEDELVGDIVNPILTRSRPQPTFMFMKDISPTLLNDPVFQRVLKDGLEIQDRFSAEPKYAQTGKGILKSAGVDELRAIKEKKASEEQVGITGETSDVGD